MSEQTKNTAEQAVDRKQFLFAGVYCAVLIAIFAIIGLSLGAQDSTDNKKSNSVTDATPTPGPVAAKELQLKILHMNDHHSHLGGEDFTVSIPGLSVEEVDVSYGGFPRIVSLMKQLEQDNENVLKLHAGDAITGTSFYSLFKGEADSEMMQHVCFDAYTLGNHEFDDGDAALGKFINDLQDSVMCPDTPVLAANLVPHADSALKALQDSGNIAANKMKTMSNGEVVGIIGIDVRNKTLLSSSPDEGTTFLDERETAIAEVKKLQNAGVNKIVLLTHIGYSNDLDWMAEIPGVDVVVGGDSHSFLGNDNAVGASPQGSFPTTVTASDGRTVCVVQAWEYGHGVGELNVNFDKEGNVVTCDGTIVFPFDPVKFDPELSQEDATAATSYLQGLGFVSVSEDADTLQALAKFEDQVDVLKQTVIATVPASICYERIPGNGRSQVCTPEETSSQGGGACNLVAKAFLEASFTADVAIQNGGGCRTDIFEGSFTIDSAFSLLPFANSLVSLTMTGEEIQLVLEQSVDFALFQASTGAYPYASGLRYDVDGTAEFGNRVQNLEINPRMASAFVPIDAGATYNVVTNNFISAGRDGYVAFKGVAADLIEDLYLEYAQSFIDFATKEGTLVDLPLEEYSTKSFTPPATL